MIVQAKNYPWFAVRQMIISLMVMAGLNVTAAPTIAQDLTRPTVGVKGKLSSVIIPGPELTGKPLVDHAPMIVQVVDVFKHGDGFRYDLEFQGFEPGKYNLAQWMVRKDNSPIGELPEIEVEVLSLLPPGIQNPHALQPSGFPSLGGYDQLVVGFVTVWTLVLLGLIFIRRWGKPKQTNAAPVASLADLLTDRLEAVFKNETRPQQHAELERMLFGMWRRRLGLESESPESALQKIQQHADAGPLMRQLEAWMHSPSRSEDVDLPTLLEPYKDIPADELTARGELR